MDFSVFVKYLAVMAGVTYLIRLLPMLLIKRKIKNRYIRSFLKYLPYSVLSVMTVPAVFFSTSSVYSAVPAFIIAVVLSFFDRKLITVAAFSCLSVFVIEAVIFLI